MTPITFTGELTRNRVDVYDARTQPAPPEASLLSWSLQSPISYAMPARKLPEKFLVAFSFAGEQRDLVSPIAEAVEQRLGEGTVFYDEWFEYYIAGDDADIKLANVYSERSVLIVACVSERYGGKPWTQAEHRAIRSLQMSLGGATDDRATLRVLPLRVGDGDVPGIFKNTICPDVRKKTRGDVVELILNRLHLIDPLIAASTTDAPTGSLWAENPPPLEWPMADHTGAREAFASLLARNARWRYLPLRGPSEVGKSHITRQMLANALRVPDLACGRFDFKGTTDMDAELSAFVQDLGVPLPPPSPRLNDRLAHILNELKQRARPALLVFDTYEAAGEARDWVEKQLLSSLIRATWLRVVIAGQVVPSAGSAVWSSIAPTPLELKPPPPADWFAFGKHHRADLTLADVETACRLASNKASLLAQLFGPVT